MDYSLDFCACKTPLLPGTTLKVLKNNAIDSGSQSFHTKQLITAIGGPKSKTASAAPKGVEIQGTLLLEKKYKKPL